MTHAIVARAGRRTGSARGPRRLTRPVAGPRTAAGEGRRRRGQLHRHLQAQRRLQGPLPLHPGSEAAGTVEAVGDGRDRVRRRATGSPRRRAAHATPSTRWWTKTRRCRFRTALDDLTTAAALPLQGITAHYLMNSTFKVAAGDTVLLHAGAGGVGLLLIQLLKARGATVITTVSTDAEGGTGARRRRGPCAAVRRLRGAGPGASPAGTGADVVYDGVGKDTFDGSLAALRIRGTLVLFGGCLRPGARPSTRSGSTPAARCP